VTESAGPQSGRSTVRCRFAAGSRHEPRRGRAGRQPGQSGQQVRQGLRQVHAEAERRQGRRLLATVQLPGRHGVATVNLTETSWTTCPELRGADKHGGCGRSARFRGRGVLRRTTGYGPRVVLRLGLLAQSGCSGGGYPKMKCRSREMADAPRLDKPASLAAAHGRRLPHLAAAAFLARALRSLAVR
jgi:hypothetical protein